MQRHLITLMVFLPFIGALLQFSWKNQVARWIALISSLAASLCAVVLVATLHAHHPDLQAIESIPWIGSYAVTYQMGVDGLNVLLVLLVAIVFPILVASEWNQKVGPRGMHGLLLVLQCAFFGAVCAQDVFLLFFFWALGSLPFYFLIGIWGGAERESAAFRAIVANSIGNALVFGALILIYYSVDPHTFLLRELTGGKLIGKNFEVLGHVLPVQFLAFSLVSAGIAIRAPIWPLHGWFSHAAKEAPLSVLVVLGGISVPVSIYVFVRFCYTLFPEVMLQVAPAIVWVGVVNLVIAGICAAAQKELRALLAFVCLAETGLILIGVGSLSSAGAVGAVYQELVLGLGLAGFGLFSGLMVDRSGHAVFLSDSGDRCFGGVAAKAPMVAVVAGVVIASLLGFPGLGGFVGHALLFIGSYSDYSWAVAVAGAMLLLATYYLFAMYREVFFGLSDKRGGAHAEAFYDLTLRERGYLFPLVGALLVFGFYPKPFLNLVEPTVVTLLSLIK